MNRIFSKISLTLVTLTFVVSCAKHQDFHSPETISQEQVFKQLSDNLAAQEVLIIDNVNAPVSNAQISIGDQKNIVQTNEAGKFLIPNVWKTESTVVVVKKGYVTTTFLNQKPEKNIFQIKIATPEVLNEVRGITTGYTNLANDGWADISIVMPTMSQTDTMSFEIGKFISPELDEMSIMGFKVTVPSNVSIPTQEEKYNWIINLTLDKPIFRTYFDTLGKKQLAAVHGRFEVKPAIKKLQGNASFLDLVNDFIFQSTEITDVELTSPNLQKNLSINAIQINSSAPHIAPNYNPQSVYLVAGLIQNNDRFVPSDLKFFTPNQSLNLLFPSSNFKRFTLAYLGEKQKIGDVVTLSPRMSLALSEQALASTTVPLELIVAPKVENGMIYAVPPVAKASMSNLGTSIVLYKVKKILTSKAYFEQKNILAEAYVPNWANEIPVPQSFIDQDIESGTRIEVSYFGTYNKKVDVPIGLPQISTSTHTTRNALDF